MTQEYAITENEQEAIKECAPIVREAFARFEAAIESEKNKAPVIRAETARLFRDYIVQNIRATKTVYAERTFKLACDATESLYKCGYWTPIKTMFKNNDGGALYRAYYQKPHEGTFEPCGEFFFSYDQNDSPQEFCEELKKAAEIPDGVRILYPQDQERAVLIARAMQIIRGAGTQKIPTASAINIYAGTKRKDMESEAGTYKGKPAILYNVGQVQIIRPLGETITRTLPDAGNDKLLRQITMMFDPAQDREHIYLTLTDYMRTRKLQDRKTAAARLDKEFRALQSDEILKGLNTENGRIGGFIAEAYLIPESAKLHAGRGGKCWRVQLTTSFRDYLIANPEYAEFSNALYASLMGIPDEHRNAYKIAMCTALHARINAKNVKDDIEQVLSVEYLLSITDIPTLEHMIATGTHRGKAGKQIANAFTREVNYLKNQKIAEIELEEDTGATADTEKAAADYEYLTKLTAHIVLNPPLNFDALRAGREEKIAAEQTATKKPGRRKKE